MSNCLYFFLNEKTLDDFMDSSIEFQSLEPENLMLKMS